MAAEQRGVILDEMVKSILLRERRRHRFVMACVPGSCQLDPQSVRQYLSGNWKRLSFASSDEIKIHTGYTLGSVAPLCLPNHIPVVMDIRFNNLAKVNISSGDPMAGIELNSNDLIRLTNAVLAPIVK
jgi:prolyl-tRNA editing enzyme YbaK/EbsC (Cys-tRNA(Pro) deacylase)